MCKSRRDTARSSKSDATHRFAPIERASSGQELKQSGRTANAKRKTHQTPCAQRFGRSRGHRLCEPAACGSAAGRGDHAGADRGRQEGRQARLLHGHGPRVRPAAGQHVRGEIPGHLRARRALRRRAHLHPHRSGVLEQHQRRRRGQYRRCRALHSSGSATSGSRRTCRRMSRSISTRLTTIPMDFT